MKTVIMIANQFPPSGAPHSHRALKWAKYLPVYGWRPIIFSPRIAEYKALGYQLDFTLLSELPAQAQIARVPNATFLLRLYKRVRGTNLLYRTNRAHLSGRDIWMRTLKKVYSIVINPDPFVVWAPFVIAYTLPYLRKADAVYAIGQPFSDLIIGVLLKKISGKPLVVDFSDLWVSKEHNYWISRTQRKIQFFQEKWVVENADHVLVLSSAARQDLLERHSSLVPRKVHVLYEGFDEADFVGVHCSVRNSNEQFVITYTGSLYYCDQYRDFQVFLSALSTIRDEYPEFFQHIHVRIAGYSDEWVRHRIDELGLWDTVEVLGFRPHSEVISLLVNSSILLLLLGNTAPSFKRMIPRKAYEYFRSGRPILAIVPPDGEVAALIRENGYGIVCDTRKPYSLVQALLQLYELAVTEPSVGMTLAGLQKFELKHLTGKLAMLLEN